VIISAVQSLKTRTIEKGMQGNRDIGVICDSDRCLYFSGNGVIVVYLNSISRCGFCGRNTRMVVWLFRRLNQQF
jgi:hypothetical protein